MNKKKIIAAGMMLMMLTPAVAFAASEPRGFGVPTDDFKGIESPNRNLFSVIVNIVNALLAFAGLIAAIFVVIGGVRYITSQGDEDAVAGAKNTILYAAVGIIVILLSAVLVNFVIQTIN